MTKKAAQKLARIAKQMPKIDRTKEIADARAALLALQNTFAYGSIDFRRVYRARMEIDQLDEGAELIERPASELRAIADAESDPALAATFRDAADALEAPREGNPS